MTKFRSLAASLLALALSPAAWSQTAPPLWQPTAAPLARGGARPEPGSWFRLDTRQLAARLAPAPPENRPTEAVLLELPYPDGTLHRFAITRVPVLAPALAARFPEIQTYAGRGRDEPAATVRLETFPAGLHAQMLLPDGEAVALALDPAADGRYHSRPETIPPFDCRALAVPGAGGARPQSGEGAAPPAPYGSQLRTLRLALAATGEYVQNLGGGNVAGTLASMATLVNSLNAVYERELALRLQLVANNDLLIYPDPATDPYDNANLSTMLNGNQAVVDGAITSGTYDVGHVLGYRSNGYSGVAYVGVICNSTYKARGVSTGASASLMAAVVTHEMGHQLGSGHTFNGEQGNCSGGNRNPNLAYEPGAGNTIMSYDSRCAPDNVGSGINYFHAGSLTDIIPQLACASTSASGNQPPSLTVPASNTYTIPVGTPFALAGSGTDPNGDVLSYSWEELDLGNASGLAGAPTDASGPLFRSFAPVASATRTFPSLTNILSGTVSMSEQLPQVARPLNFRLTARDNRGGVAGANVTLAVAAAGPFAVTAPSGAITAVPGSTYALTWNVLGTDQAPVSCANVQVLFSNDGGLTFPTVLLTSTPNDGLATVRLPSAATTQGRLKIQALNNVFFAVNNTNITLAGTPLPVELAAFTAAARGPVAHLAWTTAFEKNNAGFEVEASADGRAYHRLGWVAGQGSSSAAHPYQFDDGTLGTASGPLVYYRLRQLDTDGTATFSPVRTVAVPAGLSARLQLWPNPAHGTVSVGGLPPGQAVQLLDLTGRVLLSAVLPAAGPLQLPLPAGLAPGVYMVRSGSQSRRLAVE